MHKRWFDAWFPIWRLSKQSQPPSYNRSEDSIASNRKDKAPNFCKEINMLLGKIEKWEWSNDFETSSVRSVETYKEAKRSSVKKVIMNLNISKIIESMNSATKRFQIGGIRYSYPERHFFRFLYEDLDERLSGMRTKKMARLTTEIKSKAKITVHKQKSPKLLERDVKKNKVENKACRNKSEMNVFKLSLLSNKHLCSLIKINPTSTIKLIESLRN